MTAPAGLLLRSTVLAVEPRGVRVAALWLYDPADPLAVTLRVRSRRECWVDWVFARDLLDEGLQVAVGDGDVRLEPFPGDGLLVTLSSPHGRALLRADAAHVRRFLCASFDLVGPGEEDVHVDVAWQLVNVDLAAWADGGGCDCGGGAW